ncbi:MAG: hypothetical protein QM764_00240 [Chitinophagaceae bacterium]
MTAQFLIDFPVLFPRMPYMLKILLLFAGLTGCIYCFGQKQRVITKVTSTYKLKQIETSYKLGNRDIGVVIYKYNNNPNIVMINVHDDEATAVEVSKQVLRKTGGTLIKIRNDSTRLIKFKLSGITYTFDPNRIFSDAGIAASLKLFNCYSPVAAKKIKGFANFLLSKIPKNNATLIALHNNHQGDYSINTYDRNGNLAADSRATYVDSIRGLDDFFLTTDEVLYNKIRAYGYNVTLQNNFMATDDGSLSILYGNRNKSYVNVETEHGKPEVQFNMLMTIINTPKRISKNASVYNFEIGDSIEEKAIKNLKVYYNDKPIGNLLSAYYAQAYNKVIGQLEIDNNFKIFSNSDLFLLIEKSGPQMEIRIDPTRERKSFDRFKETLQVNVRKELM